MTQLKAHISLKIITVLLAISLLVPTTYKFVHIFANHKHDICKGEKTPHLHEINSDCDFFKFKLNNTYTFTFFNIELFSFEESGFQIQSQYHYLSKFQQLQTYLRGPPYLI